MIHPQVSTKEDMWCLLLLVFDLNSSPDVLVLVYISNLLWYGKKPVLICVNI